MYKTPKTIPALTQSRLKEINRRSSISSGSLQILHQLDIEELDKLIELMPKQKIGYVKIGYRSFICDRAAFNREFDALTETEIKNLRSQQNKMKHTKE